jgi:hypothetical protein
MSRLDITRYALRAAMVIALSALAACTNEKLNSPEAANAIFDRYVALGNSITAGFQSGGIDDSTQLRSYAVLVAKQMETDFNVPLLNTPGCPPPYTDIFTQTRLGGGTAADCELREWPVPTVLNNLAVPGAAAIDPISNSDPSSGANGLTMLILGGRTQLEAAREVEPTFVSVWIGNNDALGAVLSGTNPGDPALVTAPATFTSRYAAMMDTLDSFGTLQGGVLIGAVQVGLAPYLTQGRAWKAFEVQFDALTAPLNAFDVNNNCLAFQALTATDTAWVSVPFPVGGTMLATAQARIDSVQHGTLNPANLVPVTMDCSVDAAMVTVAEMVNIFSAVAQYNAEIESEATSHGWAYVDPNVLLEQGAATPGALRPFPAFLPTDPQHATAPFGTLLSFDGIHPSSAAHKMIANAVIAAINSTYGTTLQTIN